MTAFKGELKGGENSDTTFSRNPLANKIPSDFIWWEKDIILLSCSSHPIVHLSCISLVQHLSSTPHHIPMAPPLSLNHQAELQLQPPDPNAAPLCSLFIHAVSPTPAVCGGSLTCQALCWIWPAVANKTAYKPEQGSLNLSLYGSHKTVLKKTDAPFIWAAILK